MIGASVNLSDGPLRELSRQVSALDRSFVKVGILGSQVHRDRGEVANLRWKGAYTRWVKAAGKYVSSGPKWSSKLGMYVTNAYIGVIHEFGYPKRNIPERSFLRMPILSRLDDELKKQSTADWERLLIAGGLVAILRAIGQASVAIVHDAFHTGGFGRWRKLKAATIARKGSSDVLVDTTQLRRSISFQVVTKGLPEKGLR